MRRNRIVEMMMLGEGMTGCVVACIGAESDATSLVVIGLLIMGFAGLTVFLKG